jgi:hypothetical protein
MELNLSTSYHPIEPLPEDLGATLEGLTQGEEGFFVLSEEGPTYLQGTWKAGEGFTLEYQAGRLEAHYHFSELLGLPVVVEIANLYMKGDVSWREHPKWEHAPLERAEEDGDEAVFLGNFEGVGARRAISALEDGGIEFLIRAEGASIQLYCGRGQAEEAKVIFAKMFPM